MPDQLHVYSIIWAKSGDHGEEPPKQVTAFYYSLTNGFYDFFVPSREGMGSDVILSVRASDVAMIERGEAAS